MQGKTVVKMPEEIQKTWNEIRVCADLIRRGKADIVTVNRYGRKYRYTRPR